jgi:hypothetical protein
MAATASSVGSVGSSGSSGSDFGAGILAGRIPRIARGRCVGGSSILMFVVLVSSEQGHIALDRWIKDRKWLRKTC